jgi:hypothetical protein
MPQSNQRRGELEHLWKVLGVTLIPNDHRSKGAPHRSRSGLKHNTIAGTTTPSSHTVEITLRIMDQTPQQARFLRACSLRVRPSAATPNGTIKEEKLKIKLASASLLSGGLGEGCAHRWWRWPFENRWRRDRHRARSAVVPPLRILMGTVRTDHGIVRWGLRKLISRRGKAWSLPLSPWRIPADLRADYAARKLHP